MRIPHPLLIAVLALSLALVVYLYPYLVILRNAIKRLQKTRCQLVVSCNQCEAIWTNAVRSGQPLGEIIIACLALIPRLSGHIMLTGHRPPTWQIVERVLTAVIWKCRCGQSWRFTGQKAHDYESGDNVPPEARKHIASCPLAEFEVILKFRSVKTILKGG